MEYEYKVVNFAYFLPEDREIYLSDVGEDGFELVSVSENIAYLKRIKPHEKK